MKERAHRLHPSILSCLTETGWLHFPNVTSHSWRRQLGFKVHFVTEKCGLLSVNPRAATAQTSKSNENLAELQLVSLQRKM